MALGRISSTLNNLISLILDWFAAFLLLLLLVHVAHLLLFCSAVLAVAVQLSQFLVFVVVVFVTNVVIAAVVVFVLLLLLFLFSLVLLPLPHLCFKAVFLHHSSDLFTISVLLPKRLPQLFLLLKKKKIAVRSSFSCAS